MNRLSLSETLSGWRLTENRAMLLFNEGSFQASARGRDLDIAAANSGGLHAGYFCLVSMTLNIFELGLPMQTGR